MSVWLGLVAFLLLLRLVLGRQDTKKKQKKYLMLSGIAVAAVMGLRFPAYSVVYDLGGYTDFYTLIRRVPWGSIFTVSEFEYGYVLLNKILASIAPWPQTIVIVEALVCVFAIGRFIYKNSDYPFEAMLFYVTLGTMAFQLTAFRQSFAMSICLLSVEMIKRRRLVWFVLMVLLASMFHVTAIAFLVAYPLGNRRPTFTGSLTYVALVVMGVLAADFATSLGNSLFGMSYGRYVGSPYGGAVPIAIFVLTIGMAIWRRSRLNSWVGLNMTVVGLAIYLMRYTTLALERVSFYFTPGVVVALPDALNSVEDVHLRAALQVVSISLAVALFVYRLFASEWAMYRFFWQ